MEKNVNEVGNRLNILLADEYLLYTKTRFANWKITKKTDNDLQQFFEQQCEILFIIIDDVAEHIRSNGHLTLSFLKDFLKVTQMYEDSEPFNKSIKFFQSMIIDHKKTIYSIKSEILPIAEKNKDRLTIDFLTGIIEQHDKMIAMLFTLIKELTSNEKLA